jgi:hypothetical protein
VVADTGTQDIRAAFTRLTQASALPAASEAP